MEESRAKRIVNELREEMFGPELEAGRQGKQVAGELEGVNPLVEMRAKEFGQHDKFGGWTKAALVALSVKSGVGEGRPTQNRPEMDSSGGKVSQRTFTKLSGVRSATTVGKYLTAWDLAAADGLVPSSDSLSVDDRIEFDDEVHTDKEWKKYFKTPGGSEPKNAFIAMNDKVVSFVESLDIEAGFSEYDDQLEVSLDTFRENLIRLKNIASSWLTKADEVARTKGYMDVNG